MRCAERSEAIPRVSSGGRVRHYPRRIHGHGHERLLRPAAGCHPGCGNGPDAARSDVSLPEVTDARRNLPEPLDLDPVG